MSLTSTAGSSIITFNAGSSSLKFSLFSAVGCELTLYGEVDNILESPRLSIYDASSGEEIYRKQDLSAGHRNAIVELFHWYDTYDDSSVIAAGHRIVHGGRFFSAPVVLDDGVIERLSELIPLAPLHQPHNLEAVKIFAELYPDIPQIACFDTAFHCTISKEAEMFAIPRDYYSDGILRYGFHGLSYEYIANVLPAYIGDASAGRIIAAHLGNGASMCAMRNRKSVATTMGFTALDGLMMGTRCGSIDAGVVLYLLEEKGMSLDKVTRLLYKESGLKGVSGLSHDMRELLDSDDDRAKEAIELFCYIAAKELSGLIPSLGGLDAIVFTAGIGENSPEIRKNICDRLSWLGVDICDSANSRNYSKICSDDSAVKLYVVPTNEELSIAMSVFRVLQNTLQ